MGNFGGSLASITSKEKKNIKSIAKSGTSPEASQKKRHFHRYVKCNSNNTSSITISVKEKVKDKTKKNTSSLKLVRLILTKNRAGY